MAYLRFASVYRSFSSIEDFEAEIRACAGRPTTLADRPHQAAPSDAPRDLEPAR